MAEDGGYRAVIQIKTKSRVDGQLVDSVGTHYEGPWDRAATAKAEVTKSRNYFKGEFVDGWIERATWTRVD